MRSEGSGAVRRALGYMAAASAKAAVRPSAQAVVSPLLSANGSGARQNGPRVEEERDGYEPHGYLIGSQRQPSQIVIFAITGGPDRWLRFRLDASLPAETFTAQALDIAKRTPAVPFHGALTGFAINFSRDRAVRYDVDGRVVETLVEPYAPGAVWASADWRFEGGNDDGPAGETER